MQQASNDECRSLLHQLADVRRAEEEWRRRAEKAEAETCSLRVQLEDRSRELGKTVADCHEMRQVLQNLTASCEQLTADNEQLRAKDDQLAQYQLQVGGNSKIIWRVNSQASTMTEKNEFITRRNETLLNKCEKLQREVKDAQSTSAATIETLQRQVDDAKREVEEQKRRNDQLDEVKRRGDQQLTAANARLAEMEARSRQVVMNQTNQPADYRMLQRETQRVFEAHRDALERTRERVDDMAQQIRLQRANHDPPMVEQPQVSRRSEPEYAPIAQQPLDASADTFMRQLSSLVGQSFN